MALTEEQIDNADKGVQFIDDIATKMGTAANRLGNQYKTIPQVIADAIADLAAQDIGAGAAAQINQRLDPIEQDAVSAMLGLRAISGIVPAEPVDGNPNVLDASAIVGPLVDGQQFDVLAITSNTGNTVITAGGETRAVIEQSGAQIAPNRFAPGYVYKLGRSAGGSFTIDGVTPLAIAPAGLAARDEVTNELRKFIEGLLGAPIAFAKGGNVNEFYTIGQPTPAANNDPFKVYATATNTGEAFLTIGDRRLRLTGGGAGDTPPGLMSKGKISTGVYSAGGGAYLVLNVTNPKSGAQFTDPLKLFRSAITDFPGGTLSQDGNGNIVATPKVVYFACVGPSTSSEDPNRAGGCLPGTSPASMLVAAVADAFGPGVVVNMQNKSFGGQTVNQYPAQYNELNDVQKSVIQGLLIGGFRNDFAGNGVNTGEVFPTTGINNFDSWVRTTFLEKGKMVICPTDPCYHVGRGLEDRESVAPGNPVYWPFNVGANWTPSQIYPPLPVYDGNGALLPTTQQPALSLRDRTGHGVKTLGSLRWDLCNALVRRMVQAWHDEYPNQVVMLDFEYSAFVNGVEPQIKAGTTPTAAYDTLYTDPGFPAPQSVHEGTYGARVSRLPPIKQMIAAARNEPDGKWVFRGDEGVPA